jgi:hypothetical protein
MHGQGLTTLTTREVYTRLSCAMERGGFTRCDEMTPPHNGDNMMSAVQRFAGIGLNLPLQFEDQTAAV